MHHVFIRLCTAFNYIYIYGLYKHHVDIQLYLLLIIDSSMHYDVFVSYRSHDEDDLFVMTELIPQLDKLGYRVCVHYRDFVAGEGMY